MAARRPVTNTDADELLMSALRPLLERGALSARVGRLEGQVRGIARMIADGADTIAVLTQIAAARHALYGLAACLVDRHLIQCVPDLSDSAWPSDRISELMRAIAELTSSSALPASRTTALASLDPFLIPGQPALDPPPAS